MSDVNPRKRSRSKSPSLCPNIDDSELSYDEIPPGFFCPITNRFISDPVKIPTSSLTYNRDSVKDSQKPEDVKPDFRMRNTIEQWFSRYDLDPPFDYISNLDELMLATNYVLKQQRLDLLCDLATGIKGKPWLVTDGGGIWCVTTLLSCPHPSPSWVATTLSIVAHVDDDNKSLIVPSDIHSDYSLLDPIARTCAVSESEDEEFQTGLINLMYTLVVDSPDTSLMAEKLGGITDTLVSYIWPVQDHVIDCYLRLLSTLEILSAEMEICEQLVDAGIMGMLFFLFDFAGSSVQRIRDDPDKLSALRALRGELDTAQLTAIKSSFKILDRLCTGSQQACSRIECMDERELSLMRGALTRCAQHKATFSAGLRVLGRHYEGPDGGIPVEN